MEVRDTSAQAGVSTMAKALQMEAQKGEVISKTFQAMQQAQERQDIKVQANYQFQKDVMKVNGLGQGIDTFV